MCVCVCVIGDKILLELFVDTSSDVLDNNGSDNENENHIYYRK